MGTTKHVRELLSVYLDQMCSDEEIKIVESHLAECAACRQELADLRKTITLVAGLKEIEPPENLWAGIEQKIQKKSFWEVFSWRPVPVAVATVTILLLAVTVNKYTTKIAEQSKTATKQDVTVGANMPLVPPLLPLKSVQGIEKKAVAKGEIRPAPAVDTMRYSEEIAEKEAESGFAGAPQEAGGLAAVSQLKAKSMDKDMPTSSSYDIEMEVEDMERTIQRLQALAENYRARRLTQYGNDQELFYHVQQQQLPSFVREVNKLGRVPRRKDASEGRRETIAVNRFGTRPTTAPQLIRIKFSPSR